MMSGASGACVPRGFLASGVSAGLKPSGAKDLALVVSEQPCTAAAVFTQNSLRAAPVVVSQERSRQQAAAYGVVVNSGCANACTGDKGLRDAREMLAAAERATGKPAGSFLACSTGPIGTFLPMERILRGIEEAAGLLSRDDRSASEAIMTTDASPKTASFTGDGWSLGAVAKGAGMIAPRMATMLAVVTTDAAVPADVARSLLSECTEATFNRITVDGDCSTNDSVILLANGIAGPVDEGELEGALMKVCGSLAQMIVADGEGATRTFKVEVAGTPTDEEAIEIARAVAASTLVKTAIWGSDPNWGRVAAAVGAASRVDPEQVNIAIEGVVLMERGGPSGREPPSLDAPHVEIVCTVGDGEGSGWYTGCDLTDSYVRFNADYVS